MEQWLNERLSTILDFPIPHDLITYILAIDNENNLNEYMKTLLDFNDPVYKDFYSELSKRLFSARVQSPDSTKNKISKPKPLNYNMAISTEGNVEKEHKESKRKTKYVNLYSHEGKNAQVVLLKGRHHCDCQASKHELINNCLHCGRIICKQEGSGPCLFCGYLVCTSEEQKEINAKTKASAKLVESLMERSRPKGWEAAMSHRNRLLEYDRSSERRTHVTDDDSDYFNVNSVWLSSVERNKLQKYQTELQEKKHASRLTRKITFDFAGRQVVEDKTIDHEVDEDKIRDITSSDCSGNKTFLQNLFIGNSSDRDVAPGFNAPLLQFDSSVYSSDYSNAVKQINKSASLVGSKVQDAEIQEMTDTGRCLSMHQPWASLLVDGIKLHEGRNWYSSHRGRLWIAATVRPPDHDVVRNTENMYSVLYPDKQLKFPPFYPTGCLLGCVNVDDCLPQEEYQKQYPEGESDSPYVFICSNPMSLRFRFPVKGQHKIYSLDKTIHQAAVKCMMKMAKSYEISA